jgi:hypothetical protein
VEESIHRYGKLGVAGPFEAVFGDECTFTAEVASIFAEYFHRLGYLTVEHLIDGDRWERLNELRSQFEEHDVRLSEVVEQIGKPSLVVDRRVLCYAPDTMETGWVFFDCWEKHVMEYRTGEGFGARWNDDPLLRNIRMPAGTFEDSLILTLYGKVLRWGPGWWIQHQSARGDSAPPGVRDQLGKIEASDPSQSLGPRRP